jgi:hypothetical protein
MASPLLPPAAARNVVKSAMGTVASKIDRQINVTRVPVPIAWMQSITSRLPLLAPGIASRIELRPFTNRGETTEAVQRRFTKLRDDSPDS